VLTPTPPQCTNPTFRIHPIATPIAPTPIAPTPIATPIAPTPIAFSIAPTPIATPIAPTPIAFSIAPIPIAFSIAPTPIATPIAHRYPEEGKHGGLPLRFGKMTVSIQLFCQLLTLQPILDRF
jgi:hypothetical protein